ncbi:MAG: glycosyltransferase [Chlamydiota bacterium]
MVKRIDLFMPPRSQYGVLHHFTQNIAEALERHGVRTRVLEADYHNPAPFIDALIKDTPDCTLSLNGLLPDEKGNFFCDMIGIPHVAFIVDSQNLFIPLTYSPLTAIVCSDQFSCEFFRGLKSKNVLFMPHGVDKNIHIDEGVDRCYDVAVLCSLIDYEGNRRQWEEKYDSAVCQAMDEAVEVTLSDSSTSYIEALVQAVDRQMELSYSLNPTKIDFIGVMDDLEMYIKGKSRIDAINAIKDARVDIFGSASETANWEQYLDKKNKNHVVHEPVPYMQALEILGQSKILLNASPWIKNGAHERIFYGLGSEALVFTNENIYLKEHFLSDQNIVLYQTSRLEDLNRSVNEYLSDNVKREKVAKAGKELVLTEHTWDSRVEILLQELEPVILRMKQEQAAKKEDSKDK